VAVTSRRLPPRPPRVVGRPWNDVTRELQAWLEKLIDAVAEGVPGGFSNSNPSTILPDSTGTPGTESSGWVAANHVHAIATDITVALGTAAAEGTSTSFSRSDHVHKRAIETTNSGLVRRRLNFGTGFTVADDAGNDEIDISLTTSPTDALLLAWVAVALADEG